MPAETDTQMLNNKSRFMDPLQGYLDHVVDHGIISLRTPW